MSDRLQTLRRAGVLSALDVQLARHLCRLAGETDPLAALGLAAASRAVGQGHVCLDLSQVAGQVISGPDGAPRGDGPWPDLAAWSAALDKSPLVSVDPGTAPATPLVRVGSRLYLTRYFLYERRLARILLARAGLDDPLAAAGALAADLDRLFAPDAASPDADQRRAAGVALARGLAVISGGPGSGKTDCVARILTLLCWRWPGGAWPRIGLAAPTGKAAKRLTESLRAALAATGPRAIPCADDLRAFLAGLEAATVHRTLGASPDGRFGHGPDQPLAAQVLVVDEASMVDLALMTRLTDALAPGARLILLGDRHQLASVEAGAILGDICSPSEASAKEGQLSDSITVLSHSFRFDDQAGIGALARAVLAGDADAALAALRAPDQKEVRLLDPAAGPAAADLAVAAYRDALAAPTPLERLAALGEFRVLCALRQGPAGVEAWNQALVARLGRAAGLPRMVLVNDHQLGLYNGDVGLLADTPDGPRVFFADRPRPLLPARLPPSEDALALTVHKSQGSEFERVLLILPDQPTPLLTRELLYTAITRAKREVIVCGSEAILRAAIERPVARMSGLRDLLWGAAATGA